MQIPIPSTLRWLACLLLAHASATTAYSQAGCPLPTVGSLRLEAAETIGGNGTSLSWTCPTLSSPLLAYSFLARATGEVGSWITLVPKVHVVGESNAAKAFRIQWPQFATPTPIPASTFGSHWSGDDLLVDPALGSTFVNGALQDPSTLTLTSDPDQVRSWYVPLLMPELPTYADPLIESRIWSASPPVWNATTGSGSFLSSIWKGTLDDLTGLDHTNLNTYSFIRQTILSEAASITEAEQILDSAEFSDVLEEGCLRITIQALGMKSIGTSIDPGGDHTGTPGLTSLPVSLPNIVLSNPITLGIPILSPLGGGPGMPGAVPPNVNVGARIYFIVRNARPGLRVRVPYIAPANPNGPLTTCDCPSFSRPTLRYPDRMMFVVPAGMQPGPVTAVLPTSSVQIGQVGIVAP